jgi:hypothetical protein
MHAGTFSSLFFSRNRPQDLLGRLPSRPSYHCTWQADSLEQLGCPHLRFIGPPEASASSDKPPAASSSCNASNAATAARPEGVRLPAPQESLPSADLPFRPLTTDSDPPGNPPQLSTLRSFLETSDSIAAAADAAGFVPSQLEARAAPLEAASQTAPFGTASQTAPLGTASQAAPLGTASPARRRARNMSVMVSSGQHAPRGPAAGREGRQRHKSYSIQSIGEFHDELSSLLRAERRVGRRIPLSSLPLLASCPTTSHALSLHLDGWMDG